MGDQTFQPITLPDLSGTCTLIARCLIVHAAGHGTAVDGICDAGGGEEPPFLYRVSHVIVVDEKGKRKRLMYISYRQFSGFPFESCAS